MADCTELFPKIVRHPYQIIAFDWDGTAVKNRQEDAAEVIAVLNDLLELSVYLVVITGTNFTNIDRQFSSHLSGPQKQNLFICTNRGSEVFGFNGGGPVLLHQRQASVQEDRLLNRIAEAVKNELGRAGVSLEIVYDRLNRRKIDLIPEWPDPPKSRIDELLARTEARLREGGFAAGIKGVYRLTERYARELGLPGARLTSDVKHIEVGLTDKADSIRWVTDRLARKRNTALEEILVLGDEFGPVAGFAGSDFHMVLPELAAVDYLSVGKEPGGVPPQVQALGGGPACFTALMRRQAELGRQLALSSDASLLLVEEGYNPLRERELESLFTISNGYLGTRGSREEEGRSSSPATLIAGVYDVGDADAIEELAVAPDWLFTRVYVDGKQLKLNQRSLVRHRRVLDLSKGLLYREWRHRDGHGRITTVRCRRLASLADPHALFLRLSVVAENYRGELRVETGLKLCQSCRRPLLPLALGQRRQGGVFLRAKTSRSDITIALAQQCRLNSRFIEPQTKARSDDEGVFEEWRWQAEMGQQVALEKFVSVFTSRDGPQPQEEANRHLQRLAAAGSAELELTHLEAWRKRRSLAAVSLAGDSAAQLWLNFAVYHLIGAGNPGDPRVSISARALTGTIYQGHIFWDTEVFILPFFIASHPPSARAALMYRYHTLPAARRRAAALGYRGALFAWESASTGDDMTPPAMLAPNGEVWPILSGRQEQHINAAVAYGVWSYWSITGDDGFLAEAGAELLVETARFWASRVRRKGGSYHIREVEGPDEYHPGVDDNSYTNMMAAWSLKRTLAAVAYLQRQDAGSWRRLQRRLKLPAAERQRWQRLAERLYRPPLSAAGVIEQFQGFFQLTDIDVRDYEPRTAPLDIILGRQQTERSQLVKQADVVMALYLLEAELSEQTIRESFLYYDRRTGQGSSLSPSIYGLVAARLGLLELAAKYFRQAATIDLANNMGNAAGGVHIAALGGLWQQMIMGFAGIRIGPEGLACQPQLPPTWERLRFSLCWHRSRLDFDIEPGNRIELAVQGEDAVRAGIFGRPGQTLAGGKVYRSLWRQDHWSDFRKAVDHEQ